MSTFNFSIDLPVRTEWANVDLLRTSVQSCFSAVFSDIAGCHALAMVTGELLENAVKYGDWRNADDRCRLRVWGEERAAHVSVENPVHPGDTRAHEVLHTLTWLQGFASADEAYRSKLMEVAAAPRELGASRLGLVRIAYEGNCALSAEIAGGVLRVCATLKV